jgi:D-glycero-D-manno-heptose 1,7-bisphosphate phosphatase
MNRHLQAVILGGGKGTRLGALGGGPKPLVEIDGRPFITYLIDNLHRFGIRDIVILAGPFASEYAMRLGNGSTAGVRITLVPEPSPAGTAGALTYAAPQLASEFLLLNGDSYFDINLLDLVVRARASGALAALTLAQVYDTGRYGTAVLDGETVRAFAEKSGAGPGLINAGIYWLTDDILVEIGTPPVSLEHTVMPRLAARGAVRGFAYQTQFIDIGTPEDLVRARTLIPKWRKRPAAFLDRDGVLNRDVGYVWRTQDFEWLPGARGAIKNLNDAGFLVIVVTNQAGIARGLYSEDDVGRLHRWINSELEREGAHIDAFYYCPHHPVDGVGTYRMTCECRKPAAGLLLQAMKDWPIDAGKSFMIGDKEVDLQAAHAAGIKGIRSSEPLDILVSGLIMA